MACQKPPRTVGARRRGGRRESGIVFFQRKENPLGIVRADEGGIGRDSHPEQGAYVSVPEKQGREMGDKIVSVPDYKKSLPAATE